MSADLPIHAVRARFTAALARGPVVLSSPTGSGKSTEVPRWCPGRVLVVEPRRVACRSLATRVAEQEGSALGDVVGYVVRDERVLRADTRIVFVTPGIALRDPSLVARADTVVLDEFHERSLELDLLLALLVRAQRRGLVVMSATLAGTAIAAHVAGEHLEAEGSAFPVDVRHRGDPPLLPSSEALVTRVRTALAEAAGDPGDVLVFLPGKAEIQQCQDALRDAPFTVLQLHGGLALDQQRRVFAPAPRRKLILATNVAETSLTIPGIGVVIDTGLVRQMRYQGGRGSLSLVPIAADSAAQRTGRAGRTAPGVCYRLWSKSARLEPATLPELQRESLVPLVLTAAAWGAAPEDLPFLDPPKAHALEAARRELAAWGALAADGTLTRAGEGLLALPVAPLHARLLQSAQERGCLEDMLDLVSVLSVARPLFSAPPDEPHDTPHAGCDLTRIVDAFRARGAAPDVDAAALHEARAQRARLAQRLGLTASESPRGFARDALIAAAIAADARVVHVARPRGRELALSHGGSELQIARDSALARVAGLEAAVVLDTRAFGTGRDARVLVTCGTPIPLAAIARAGLGEERISAVRREGGRVECTFERVYANRVVGECIAEPRGAQLRAALCTLLERGSVYRDAIATSRERLARTVLAHGLAARRTASPPAPTPDLGSFLRARLDAMGVEEPDDLALLSASDFLAPDLPAHERAELDAAYPLEVSVGDACYRADYDVTQMQVLLVLVKGTRKEPPPLAYLPRFPGFRICVSGPHGTSVLRPR